MLSKKLLVSCLLGLVIALGGCNATIPKDALKLTPETLEKRSLQTRMYQGLSEEEILSASAGVIQDLGFTIEESETKLGVIVGTKDRDATETGQVVAAVAMAILFGADMSVDKNQKMRVSLVVKPVENANKEHYVRATFQRIVWNTKNQVTKAEQLDQPETYTQFFDRLSKAVFLEGHRI